MGVPAQMGSGNTEAFQQASPVTRISAEQGAQWEMIAPGSCIVYTTAQPC